MKFFKKCSCGTYYPLLDLPPLLRKPKDETYDDPFEYFNCDLCHSTLTVKSQILNDLFKRVEKVL